MRQMIAEGIKAPVLVFVQSKERAKVCVVGCCGLAWAGVGCVGWRKLMRAVVGYSGCCGCEAVWAVRFVWFRFGVNGQCGDYRLFAGCSPLWQGPVPLCSMTSS